MTFDFECAEAEAHDWMVENVPSYQLARFPNVLNTLTGEPRFMLDIALAMIADGLTCPNSDRVDLAA
jgi:hypothetical protein